MKLLIAALLASFTCTVSASAAIVERRIWIESALEKIREQMCSDKLKTWRCIWNDRNECDKVMKEAYPACAQSTLPDLPEYIDSDETLAQAQKVVKDCMTTELARKYVLSMSKERMEEYNICTGVAKREKPINPQIQKALDFSKTMTSTYCTNGSYWRKCYSLPEKECSDLFAKHHLACAMKMEKDGVTVKNEEASVQDIGKKITECALDGVRKDLGKPKVKDKECD